MHGTRVTRLKVTVNMADPRCLLQALAVCTFKGTNGRQNAYEIFHVYCIFYSGFMCQTTVIFGITKDGSLVLNTLASQNCFTCRNFFQNGANDMSECLGETGDNCNTGHVVTGDPTPRENDLRRLF